MGSVRRRSFKQAMAVSGAAGLAAAALAGCSAQPPDGSEAGPESEAAGPSATVPAEDLGWILEEQEDDSFGGGAGGRGGGSVYLSIDEESVPARADTVEAHVFCLPNGASVPVGFNGESSAVECGGEGEAQVVEMDASKIRDAGYVSLQLDDRESPKSVGWAVVFKAS